MDCKCGQPIIDKANFCPRCGSEWHCRKFLVDEVASFHDPKFVRRLGIWRGDTILAHADDVESIDELHALKVGESQVFCLKDFQEPAWYVRATRIPNNAAIPDERGWFTRLLHRIF